MAVDSHELSRVLSAVQAIKHGPVGVDAALCELGPAIQAMANDGSVVVMKLDGLRVLEGIKTIYTVVVSGGKLGEDFFRRDSESLVGAMSEAVLFYNKIVWKY